MNKKIYQIVLIISLLLIAPMIVNAEGDVFEHDKIEGNVFLKGKYIQLGINGDTGVFGTTPIVVTPSNKETIGKYATTELKSGESLGMRYNQYGWDSGKVSTTGDFTVNATKENEFNINSSKDTLAFIFCEKECGTNIVYSLRGDGYRGDGKTEGGITITSIDDQESDQATGVLKAVVNGEIPDYGLQFTITYWFHKDDKFFNTKVEVENIGTKKIVNLKVMRLMNPDQDKLINRTSLTYNKVISKTRDAQKDPGYSMVVSRGEVTLDGMFYLTFDRYSYPALNAKYYTVNNTTEAPKDVLTSSIVTCGMISKECPFMPNYPKGMPFTASTDSLSIFYQDNGVNGHSLSDTSISMLTVAGDIASENDKATVEYYTSLDNDVISGLAEVLADHNVSVISRTDTTIKIKTETNEHYSIVECPIVDGEADLEHCTLPDHPVIVDDDPSSHEYTFEHLKPSTLYKIYYKDGDNDFETTAIIAQTKAPAKKAVDIQAVVVTEDSVTIKGDHGYIYKRIDKDNWQTSETFDGLAPDTEYTFVGRAEETYYDMPGELSEPLIVRTLPKAEDAPNIPSNIRIEVKIVDAVPTIKFNKALLYEAIKDDADIQDAVAHDLKTQIIFDVIKLYPNDEELQDLKPYMKNKKLAYGFDVEIKLYVNGDHIKDISELSKDLDLEVVLPNEYKEKDRKFFVIRKHIISIHEPALYETLNDLDSSDDTISIKNNLFSEFYVTYYVPEVNNPKTNDNIVSYIILLLTSGFILYNKKKKLA